MDHRPRRSVFDRLGRVPRDQSNTRHPGLLSGGRAPALLPGPPPPLLRNTPRHEMPLFQHGRGNNPNHGINPNHHMGHSNNLHNPNLHNNNNNRRRPMNYDDHYGHPQMKKSRMEHSGGPGGSGHMQDKHLPPPHLQHHQQHHPHHQAPLLQLRQMPPMLSQPPMNDKPLLPAPPSKTRTKVRLRRKKPRPLDETLDEGEIVDDDDDEFEEYSASEEEDEAPVKVDLKINYERRNVKESDNLSLKSFDSSSDRAGFSKGPLLKLPTQQPGSSSREAQGKQPGELTSDKGSNYSDWSDDELLLREDGKERKGKEASSAEQKEEGEEPDSEKDTSTATKDGDERKEGDDSLDRNKDDEDTKSDLDSVANQSSGSARKIQELEAISDDDFDAYDHDLLERNKDACMELVIESANTLSTNDVSINDILSIDWKSLLPPTQTVSHLSPTTGNDSAPLSLLSRRSSTECRASKSKCCFEMLNRIGHSVELAGQELSERIVEALKKHLGDDYVEQTDTLPLIHQSRFRTIVEERKKARVEEDESATHFRVEPSAETLVL